MLPSHATNKKHTQFGRNYIIQSKKYAGAGSKVYTANQATMWAFCGGALSLCRANIYRIFYVPTLKRGLPKSDCHKWNHKVHAFFLHNPKRINHMSPKSVSTVDIGRVQVIIYEEVQ